MRKGLANTLGLAISGKHRRLWAGTAAILLFPSPCLSQAQAGTPLSDGTALYARAVRLADSAHAADNGRIVVSVTVAGAQDSHEDFYSGDPRDGFHRIGSIQDASFRGGLCCGTLYELPRKIGSLEAGTLLWAGSVGFSSSVTPMRLEIYASKDGGVSWTYLSDCAASKQPRAVVGGLWEPEFTTATDGALVCLYSDETRPGHSQVLNRVRSYDGVHWSAPTEVVALSAQAARPGMPVVSRLRGDLYFMTYEVCGVAACAAYSRTSRDGWSWGEPSTIGSKLLSSTGSFFEHAPTNSVVMTRAGGNGLLLVGQMLMEADGSVSKRNGEVLFRNDSVDGSGPWRVIPAPVPVPHAFDNYCPNYSSSLLPSLDGASVLEFASDYTGGTCRMYYGTGSLFR